MARAGGWQRGSARRCLTLLIDLISLERLPVAAGGNVAGQATDLACAGCGAPHRCIGWASPKRWEDKECWSVPELHPREHDPASLGILHEPLGSSTGNLQLPAPTRSKGPRSYSAGWALWWRSAYDGLHRKGEKTRSDWMDCLFQLKRNHNITVAGVPLGS